MPDVLPPITSHDYDNTLRNADFTITLSSVDPGGSGVAQIYYRLNFGPVKTVSTDGQPLVTTEGLNNVLEYWAKDLAGNTENLNVLLGIQLDKSSPFDLTDLSGLNGGTVQSSHAREISIYIKDGIQLANTVDLHYFRTGYDILPQQEMLQLDVAGAEGQYLGTIDENPDGNYSVTSIKYWIEGDDAAGNPILIGGSQLSPLSTYTVDDDTPFFIENYTENERIGQTKTVKNLGWANTYINQQVISLEIKLNKSTFFVSADFSPIDSFYVPGQETITNLGGGLYQIYYEISATNTIIDRNIPITITATDGGFNTTIDASFLVSSTDRFALVDAMPDHNASNIHIDSSLVLQFNDDIIDDGFISGHVYITDSGNRGLLLDYKLINNTLIITPVKRLKPQEPYTIHINPGLVSNVKFDLAHYNEVAFTTGDFYVPLVPNGYSVTNASNNPLSILDTSLKICNNKSMCVTWPAVPNDAFNGADLRDFPIMVSDSNSALFWAEGLHEPLKISAATIEVRDLLDLVYPRIKTSQDNTLLVIGGIPQEPIVLNYAYSSNVLSFELDHIESTFVDEADPIYFATDGQHCLIRLAWCLPQDLPTSHIALVRNSTGFPTSLLDGDIIYDSDGEVWYDINRQGGTPYYYRLFIYNPDDLLYDFVIVRTAMAPEADYKISFAYGEYETSLITNLPNFHCPALTTVEACKNAIKDISNNGNDYEDQVPLFREFKLGRNVLDDENRIVANAGNTITIELSPNLAFKIKDLNKLFVLCEKEAALDVACNGSPMSLKANISLPVDPNSHPLLHAIPVERTGN